MGFSRTRERPGRSRESAGGRVENFQAVLRYAGVIAPGDERGAVRKKRCSVAGARRLESACEGPGVGNRVVNLGAVDRGPAAADAAGHQHAAVFEHGRGVFAAREAHTGGSGEVARGVEDFRAGATSSRA